MADKILSDPLHQPNHNTEREVKSPQHDEETHGTSNDIDETTPVEAVKGPGVFQRVKEEVEAVIEAFLPKKDSNDPK